MLTPASTARSAISGRNGSIRSRARAARPSSSTGNPSRSSCAVHVGSYNANRESIYFQQQTHSACGLSGIAFSTNVPHTVRGKGARETKQCTDCHLSKANDNNAWMAELLMHGTDVQLGSEPAVAGVDEHEAVVGLDEQSRDTARELPVGVEVRAHELALDGIVVPLEDESGRDRPPPIDQDVARDATRVQPSRSISHSLTLVFTFRRARAPTGPRSAIEGGSCRARSPNGSRRGRSS